MIHEPEGFAVHNGISILEETFSFRKTSSWDAALVTFDEIYDAGGYPENTHVTGRVPSRPFGIVGRGEYPRWKPRDKRIAWLRRHGCEIAAAKIVLRSA